MSEELKVCFGKDWRGNAQVYDFDNILIHGAVGTGKSVLMNNIMAQIILNNGENGFYVSAWDGKASDLVPVHCSYGIVQLSGCIHTSNFYEDHLFTFMERVIDGCDWHNDRPHVILMDEISAYARTDWDKFVELMSRLMDACEENNMYVVLSDSGLLTNPEEHIWSVDIAEMFNTRVCFSAMEAVSNIMIGSAIAADGLKRGTCYLYVEGDEPVKLDVPFYSREKKRKIANGLLLPGGQKYSKRNIEAWARYAGIN